jgi:tetratricopeptide (TPR) repeat protein
VTTAVVVLLIGGPALLFALWPLLRRTHAGRTFLPLPPDEREQLLEQKRRTFRLLRELAFEHEAGHVSDQDYAELRARYEAEAAGVIATLDRLAAASPPADPSATPGAPATGPAAAPVGPPRAAWRHPVAMGAGAGALVAFGIVLGAGIVRHTAPDPLAGMPTPGSRPLATLAPATGGPATGGMMMTDPSQPVAPGMLAGMLEAARASLTEGRYGEAIAAYQAILRREPDNVDALTHLGLIVAIGGHADAALETFERVLAIDPHYPPALLYHGQVLYESKGDAAGAIQSWERFVALAPPGEDRERVSRMIAEARGRSPVPRP